MPETREQIIERMARRAFETANGFTEFKGEFKGSAANQWLSVASSALPVAVKAVTDRVRELHIEQFWNVHDEVWRTNPRCDECGQAYPCPTVRLLDQIDAEIGGE